MEVVTVAVAERQLRVALEVCDPTSEGWKEAALWLRLLYGESHSEL
mgnify:CR=1 FL=1